MIRLASIIDEVLQNPQADVAALLRMELNCEEVVPGDGGGELDAVLSGGGHDAFVIRQDVIGMDEVEIGIVGDSLEERGRR